LGFHPHHGLPGRQYDVPGLGHGLGNVQASGLTSGSFGVKPVSFGVKPGSLPTGILPLSPMTGNGLLGKPVLLGFLIVSGLLGSLLVIGLPLPWLAWLTLAERKPVGPKLRWTEGCFAENDFATPPEPWLDPFITARPLNPEPASACCQAKASETTDETATNLRNIVDRIAATPI
jgi:hypothetical protein